MRRDGVVEMASVSEWEVWRDGKRELVSRYGESWWWWCADGW